MTCEQISVQDKNCLAKATILMGAAALEALLTEVAYLDKPELYNNKSFLKAGFKKKVEMLKGNEYVSLYHEANKLWEYRKAIAHSEPINERSLNIGEIINSEGAKWVYKTLEEFSRIVWKSEIPVWFSETTGIRKF